MNLNRLENNRTYGIAFFANILWMVLGPLIFLIIIGSIFFRGVNIQDLQNDKALTAFMLADFVSKLVPIFASIFIFRKLLLKDTLDFKKKWANYILIIAIGFLSIIVLNILAELIYTALGVTGTSENQLIIERALTLSIRPFVVIIILVFAPILEELIFRKFLIKYLQGLKLGNWLPYLVSAIVFAAIHMDGSLNDLIFFPMYFILSASITLAYKYSGDNIYVSTGIHFLNNLLSLLGV